MDLDLEKAAKFVSDHAASYVAEFTGALARPSLVTPGVASLPPGHSVGLRPAGGQLSPSLMVFVLFSIVLGATLNSLIPKTQTAPGMTTTLVVVSVWWLSYGSVVHGFCKSIGGIGSYVETLASTLRVSAAIYVVDGFVALVLSAVARVGFVGPPCRES